MGRIMSFDQDGRRVRDFDKSEHDFLRRYGRTPEEVMDENAKLIVKLNAEHIARQNVEIENTKLRELMSVMAYCNQFRRDCDGCSMNGAAGIITERAGCDELLDRLRNLGIEVPS